MNHIKQIRDVRLVEPEYIYEMAAKWEVDARNAAKFNIEIGKALERAQRRIKMGEEDGLTVFPEAFIEVIDELASERDQLESQLAQEKRRADVYQIAYTHQDKFNAKREETFLSEIAMLKQRLERVQAQVSQTKDTK